MNKIIVLTVIQKDMFYIGKEPPHVVDQFFEVCADTYLLL